jgi:uncharacterized protein
MRPAPVLTEDNEAFWRAAADGRLVIQRCTNCSAYHHPPRPMCPVCHSLELRWADMAGTGFVYSYSLLDHPKHPAFSYPVSAVVVELDEGVRIVSNLVDIDPQDISIGLRVEVVFEPTAEDLAVPVFRPETDQA